MKKKNLWIIVATLVVVAVAVAVFSGLSTGGEHQKKPAVKLQTKFGKLEFPVEYAENLKHTESEEAGAVVEIFSLVSGEMEYELFRIYFGEASNGSIVGYFCSDSEVVPVSVVIGDSQKLESAAEETATQYYSMMEGLNEVLSSIYENEKFTKDEFGNHKESVVKLTHWQVTLPDTMAVTENTADGVYEAVFYGDVVGEGVALYRISIGEEKEDVPLGYFKLDGVKKAVYVQSYELEERESWSEDDYATAYRMMDTINHVIETIMQSKQFSADAE